MSPTLEEKVEEIQKNGFEYITEDDSSSSDGEASSSSSSSANRTARSFSDHEFDEDDREFELGEILENNALPPTASEAEIKRRADWARNVDLTLDKINKYDNLQKKLQKEMRRRKRKLARVLKQFGCLTVRQHFPGTL